MKNVTRKWYDILPFPMLMTFLLVLLGQLLS